MPRNSGRPKPEPWSDYKLLAKRKIWLPFYYLESTWEWLAHALSNWAFLEALEYLGRFSVLFAVVFYVYEAPDRKKQKHYQAWQVINTSQGKGGSGGRIEALQELNIDRVPLVGVNAAGAFLQGIQLPGANLFRADLEACDLRDANLRAVDLRYANLRSANFRQANLSGARLHGAVLQEADLVNANLRGADLSGANLENADLGNVNIEKANIRGVLNAPKDFVAWAMQHQAV